MVNPAIHYHGLEKLHRLRQLADGLLNFYHLDPRAGEMGADLRVVPGVEPELDIPEPSRVGNQVRLYLVIVRDIAGRGNEMPLLRPAVIVLLVGLMDTFLGDVVATENIEMLLAFNLALEQLHVGRNVQLARQIQSTPTRLPQRLLG